MAKIEKNIIEYYSFYCPGCKRLHVYPVGARGTTWQFNGNMENPSFTPSLKNTETVQNKETQVYEVKSICHLFVTNGKIVYCGDCTHELSGQTIELPEIK